MVSHIQLVQMGEASIADALERLLHELDDVYHVSVLHPRRQGQTGAPEGNPEARLPEVEAAQLQGCCAPACSCEGDSRARGKEHRVNHAFEYEGCKQSQHLAT